VTLEIGVQSFTGDINSKYVKTFFNRSEEKMGKADLFILQLM